MLLSELTKAGITMERLSEELKLPADVIENKLAGREHLSLYEAGTIKRLFATKGKSISYEEISERTAG